MARTEFLATQGYRVIRFSNTEVMVNLEGVLSAIAETLRPPLPSPARSHVPPGSPEGGGSCRDRRTRTRPPPRRPLRPPAAAGGGLSASGARSARYRRAAWLSARDAGARGVRGDFGLAPPVRQRAGAAARGRSDFAAQPRHPARHDRADRPHCRDAHGEQRAAAAALLWRAGDAAARRPAAPRARADAGGRGDHRIGQRARRRRDRQCRYRSAAARGRRRHHHRFHAARSGADAGRRADAGGAGRRRDAADAARRQGRRIARRYGRQRPRPIRR